MRPVVNVASFRSSFAYFFKTLPIFLKKGRYTRVRAPPQVFLTVIIIADTAQFVKLLHKLFSSQTTIYFNTYIIHLFS